MPAMVHFDIGADDLDTCVKDVQNLGGTVVQPGMPVPGWG